jgi:hypothetical protein
MARFILRFTGKGPKPRLDVERIRAERRLTVLDESERMVLVEATDEKVVKIVAAMPEWTWSPERTFRLPDSRPRPRHDRSQ